MDGDIWTNSLNILKRFVKQIIVLLKVRGGGEVIVQISDLLAFHL